MFLERDRRYIDLLSEEKLDCLEFHYSIFMGIDVGSLLDAKLSSVYGII